MTVAVPSPAAATTKKFLAALSGARQRTPPIWLMRQAGRYLPEYREIRAKAPSFIDFCYTPHLAAEATLQPIRRFGFDAAILFSDILVMPDALGQSVSFESGEGPRLRPIETAADFAALREAPDWSRLAPVFETVERVRGALLGETAVIGFCGAPWTVASYMIAGHGTPDQAPARLFAYREPELFSALIDRLADSSADYLALQIRAGAEAVQIFDSWAGVLPPAEFERWCVKPIERLIARLRSVAPATPIIAFPRGAATQLGKFADVEGLAAIGLDTAVDPRAAADLLPGRLALQGNLDPLALLSGGRALDEGVARVREGFAGRAHIFNLGHGILPETPILHVERLMTMVRQTS
jgi:uroporphyrinogen decarboxylase